jgi:hypothetical protein
MTAGTTPTTQTGAEPGQQAGAGGTGGVPPAQQQGGGQQGQAGKVTFTPEQQEYINSLVGSARTEGRTAGKTEAEQAVEAAKKKAEEDALAEQNKFKELAEQRQAKITELEGTTGTLAATYRANLTKVYVELAAAKLNVVDTEAVYALLDKSKVEYDAQTGVPTNLDALVKALTEAKPYLIGSAERPKGIPGTPRPAGATTQQEVVQERIKAKKADPAYRRW